MSSKHATIGYLPVWKGKYWSLCMAYSLLWSLLIVCGWHLFSPGERCSHFQFYSRTLGPMTAYVATPRRTVIIEGKLSLTSKQNNCFVVSGQFNSEGASVKEHASGKHLKITEIPDLLIPVPGVAVTRPIAAENFVCAPENVSLSAIRSRMSKYISLKHTAKKHNFG